MSASRSKTPESIDWEGVDSALSDGLEDLLAAHWEEVALNRDDIPLAVDWSRYRQLERMGVLKALSMRKAGRLVGYNVFFVQPPIHYSTSVWAVNDILYLTPAERRGMAGARMIREAERRFFGEMKLAQIIYHTKLHLKLGARERVLGDLLRAMRYTQTEEVFAKTKAAWFAESAARD
jgi:hypothetical protein